MRKGKQLVVILLLTFSTYSARKSISYLYSIDWSCFLLELEHDGWSSWFLLCILKKTQPQNNYLCSDCTGKYFSAVHDSHLSLRSSVLYTVFFRGKKGQSQVLPSCLLFLFMCFFFLFFKVFNTWICYFFTACQQSKLSLVIKNVLWFCVGGEVWVSFMREENWKEVEKRVERIKLQGGDLKRKPWVLISFNSMAPLL